MTLSYRRAIFSVGKVPLSTSNFSCFLFRANGKNHLSGNIKHALNGNVSRALDRHIRIQLEADGFSAEVLQITEKGINVKGKYKQ